MNRSFDELRHGLPAGDEPCEPDELCDEEGDVCVFQGPCLSLPNPPVCLGDADGDGYVGTLDTGAIKAAFGFTGSESLCRFDVDCDGAINTLDIGAAQAAFGVCHAGSPEPCYVNP